MSRLQKLLNIRHPGRTFAALLAFIALAAIIACAGFGSKQGSKTMQQSDHFYNGKFHNLIPGEPPLGRSGGFKIAYDFLFDKSSVREPLEPVATMVRNKSDFEQLPESGLRLTWIGHSTYLIEIDGKRVLTDPIWSDRASPVSFLGPQRFYPVPLALEDLPPLDAVVISHDHFDHLDRRTIQKLIAKTTLFVAPLKVAKYLLDWGVPAGKIRELDWWQETQTGKLRLVCTPARHFSGRKLIDSNKTLWASWAIIGPEHRVYFSGDTGMSNSFTEIGRRLGPFTATIIEIGAYGSGWPDIHIGPEQAVQAHLQLGGQLLLPVHWGTFNLAMHTWTAPAERLIEAARAYGVALAIPQPGQSVEPNSPPEMARWWPDLPWQNAEQEPIVSPGLATEERNLTVPQSGFVSDLAESAQP